MFTFSQFFLFFILPPYAISFLIDLFSRGNPNRFFLVFQAIAFFTAILSLIIGLSMPLGKVEKSYIPAQFAVLNNKVVVEAPTVPVQYLNVNPSSLKNASGEIILEKTTVRSVFGYSLIDIYKAAE